VCRVLVRKPEGRRPLRRLGSRWEDNIKMNLQKVGCGDMDWFELAQYRNSWQALVNAVMNLRFP
jgi:ribosome biogenesis protein Nip4